MDTIIISDLRQTIWDVALQTLGNVENIDALLEANGIDVNADLYTGQKLILPSMTLSSRDRAIAAYYAQNNITIVGGASLTPITDPDFDMSDFDDTDFDS
jgi:hypothetical protein